MPLIADGGPLPAQFYPPRYASGELRLWLAVIEQAFREADHWLPEYRRPARAFIRGPEFAAVCELVGLEADSLRGRKLRWRRRTASYARV